MKVLSNDEVHEISGGFVLPFAVEVGLGILTYVGAIDAARSFGEGLGSGFYDGVNERD